MRFAIVTMVLVMWGGALVLGCMPLDDPRWTKSPLQIDAENAGPRCEAKCRAAGLAVAEVEFQYNQFSRCHCRPVSP